MDSICSYRGADLPLELEACLVVLGRDRAAWLHELVATPLGEPRTTAFERLGLEDVYYDTAARDLARADMALRVRSEERAGRVRKLLTWKGPCLGRGATSIARAELEDEPSARHLEAVSEAAGLTFGAPRDLEDWLASAGLDAFQSRRTTRALALVLDEARSARAELVADEVEYRFEDLCVVHRELELESLGAMRREELEDLAGSLTRADPARLAPWPWSKTALGQALADLWKRGELQGLMKDSELTDSGYARVRECLAAPRS